MRSCHLKIKFRSAGVIFVTGNQIFLSSTRPQVKKIGSYRALVSHTAPKTSWMVPGGLVSSESETRRLWRPEGLSLSIAHKR